MKRIFRILFFGTLVLLIERKITDVESLNFYASKMINALKSFDLATDTRGKAADVIDKQPPPLRLRTVSFQRQRYRLRPAQSSQILTQILTQILAQILASLNDFSQHLGIPICGDNWNNLCILNRDL